MIKRLLTAKFRGGLFVERVCHDGCQEKRIKMENDGRGALEMKYK